MGRCVSGGARATGRTRRLLVDTPGRKRVARRGTVTHLSDMDSPIAKPRASSRAQLPSDTHIGRVRLRVGDLERSLRFYRDVLGFRVAREEGSRVALAPRSANQQGDGDTDGAGELILLEEKPGIRRRPSRPATTGLYHVALLVPSRAELGRALLGLNQAQYPLRGMSDHAVSESLYLDDPDGNGLEIYADRPRGQWPVSNGVVQMTVDPMDVEGVISAAQPVSLPWRGLPAGTVVGHVHFTVSDLERAVKFYRNVIGFDMMMRIPSLAAVSAGGYHHHVNLNTWAGEGAPPDSDQVAGLAGWELRVPDARARRDLIDRLAIAKDPDAIPIDIESAP
jgi:catechol 2,3-dioxygenase